MSEIAINSFEGGMNFDLSKVVHTKNASREIRNFRPYTDEQGKSIGGLINIAGNELSFTYPTTNRVVKFICEYTFPAIATDTIGFTINGVLTNIVFNVIGLTNEEIAENYVEQINNNAYCIANQIYAYINDAGEFTVYCLANGVAFDAGDGSAFLARVQLIAPQSNLRTIGWCTLRDDFYLFTTNNTSSTGGVGQIWKLEIDLITKVTTLTIKYNNNVNFSTEYPIEAVGRYETSNIQKIYWTDNFNKVRTLNVSDHTSFELSLDLIDLAPITQQSQPVLQEVLTGGLQKTGIIQFAYRLKTLSGGETSFSPLSRIIPVTLYDEYTTNNWEYIGSASDITTAKSYRVRIDDIDDSYDLIELVVLYKANKEDLPTIKSIARETLTSSFFEYIYTGLETNTIEISIEEFLLSSSTFTHAKTLTTKDNHLFVGNVKRDILNIPHSEFDARAYGFKLSTDEFEVDGITYDLGGGATFADVPETANAINTSGEQFVQNSSLYGGTGQYISYKIKTKAVPIDDKPLITTGSDYENLPYRNVTTSLSSPQDLNEGRTYPQPAIFSNLANPHIYDLYRGYQRDEVYRFGIVFYDKQGNPGYVNWIADIKIPECYSSILGYTNASFRGKVIEEITTAKYQVNIPYVEFEVNLPPYVVERVSGYSIVRVERTREDKSIVGQGLAFPIGPKFVPSVTGLETLLGPLVQSNTYMMAGVAAPNQTQERTLASSIQDAGGDISGDISGFDYLNEYFTAQIPENLLNNDISLRAGDYVKTVDLLGSLNADQNQDTNFRYDPSKVQNSVHLFKKYKYTVADSQTYTLNKERDITNLWFVDDKQEITIDSGIRFRNEAGHIYTSSGKHATYNAYGTKTLLFKTDTALFTNITAGGFDYREAVNNFFIINYKRDLLSQYGGNTYNQRSNNEYISTGNYIAVDDTYTTQTFDVTGGDTYITIFDNLKYRKPWDIDDTFDQSSYFMFAQGYMFAVESQINCELRHGLHLKAYGLTDDGFSGPTDRNNTTLINSCDIGEQFRYNKVFSSENTIRKYFAKPTFFNEVLEFDTRIYNSVLKINGESIDSWRYFKPNDYLDLDSEHGPINKIIVNSDTFYSFQDDAVAIVGVNPRAVVQDIDGTSLELGTGLTLNDYAYASTSIGAKHQWGVIPAKSFVYFTDIKSKKIFRISSQGLEPLSDIKGFSSYLSKNLEGQLKLDEKLGGDNPIIFNGITGYYDHINNEVIFTILNTQTDIDDSLIPIRFSLVYNENTESFSSFYDFTSNIYPHNRSFIFSPNPTQLRDVYIHNFGNKGSFYGVVYDSTVSPVLNDKPMYTKTFDNLFWHSESVDTNLADVQTDTFYELDTRSTYQTNLNYQLINSTTLKRKERTWQTATPRSSTNLERFRDKHLELTLRYDNTPNNRFLIHFLGYVYRISYR
jgi:hypothetical protein